MSDILGSADHQIIQQVTGGSDGVAGLLKKLGSVGQSFSGTQSSTNQADPLDAFIQSMVGAPQAAPNLGSVSSRLLVGRGGAPSTALGNVANRLLPRQAPPSATLPPPVLPPILGSNSGNGAPLLGPSPNLYFPPSLSPILR